MMLDWNDYRRQLAAGVKQVGQLSPDTVKGYIEPSSAGTALRLQSTPVLRSFAQRACLMPPGTILALRRRRHRAADTRHSVEHTFH
jgi:hypothetical protein